MGHKRLKVLGGSRYATDVAGMHSQNQYPTVFVVALLRNIEEAVRVSVGGQNQNEFSLGTANMHSFSYVLL